MAKGLDIGTAIIMEASVKDESAGQSDSNVELKMMRDAYLSFPISEQENLMLARVHYNQVGEELLVVGNEAIQMGATFEREVLRPLKAGIVDMQDKQTQHVLRYILRNIPGPAKYNGEVIYYSIPARPVDNQYTAWDFHKAFFKQELASLGYNAEPLIEPVCVGYSELSEYKYTGICFSFGAGMTNVCYLNRGMEVLSFSCPVGGDVIDKEAAKVLGTSASHMTVIKEKGIDLNAGCFTDTQLWETVNNRVRQEVQTICTVYRYMVDYVIKTLVNEFKKPQYQKLVLESLPVVIAGGTSKPVGFANLVIEMMKKNNFPYPLGNVIVPYDPLICVAKGSFLRAQLRTQMLEGQKEETVSL